MMHYLKIKGNAKLSGEVKISGAKNAALPIIALTLLAKKSVNLTNIPNVADIKTLCQLLTNLGAKCEFKDKNSLSIDTSSVSSTTANYDIVRKMRASILTLGPLLARFGHCEVSLPGGCAIGQRPIDLHLNALEKMGANIEIKQGYVVATAPNGLKGAKIVFDKITVTGSENIIMAAALAHGTTELFNVALEPEVVQICEILAKSGVKIEGIGTSELKITGSGQKLLEICDIEVIPDRIEAGTYLCAGAITNSKISVTKANAAHMTAILNKFEEMGFGIEVDGDKITILPAKEIKPVEIRTTEYPGFPTDMQAQFMALTTIAEGTSTVTETVFENRFMHVAELRKMGAHIDIDNRQAIVEGMPSLHGAIVNATDLRAGAALVCAALTAEGRTEVGRLHHIDRGYDDFVGKLQRLGADIVRVDE